MGIWSLQKIFFFGLKWRTLLVLDNTTTHKINKVNEDPKNVIYQCQSCQMG